MNKYNKRFHKEIKAYMRKLDRLETEYSYGQVKKALKLIERVNHFTPCQNCDTLNCLRTKNKIVFCEYNS